MEPGTVTRVLQDVFTTTDGEISLTKGDILQVIRPIDKYWCHGNSAGRVGSFPTDKLIAIETPPINTSEELFLAVADFPGQQEGDLNFRKGEFVIGVQKLDEHWWEGYINKYRVGVFPDTFTWQLDSHSLKGQKTPKALNLRARVKMSLRAQLDEEMDLNVGDIVTILEETDKGWYRGTCGDKSGIFPAAYITILDDAVPSYNDIPESGSSQSNFNSSTSRPTSTSTFSSSTSSLYMNTSNFESSSNRFSNDINSNYQSAGTPSDLMTFSPEKERQVHPSLSTSDLDILNDDYFKVNMPSAGSVTSFSEIDSLSASATAVLENSHLRTNYIQELQRELDIIQPYGMTLYPFYAQYANELSFHENEIVHLIRYVDDDWLEGEIDGRKGIFPVSYVNILVDCDKRVQSGTQESKDDETLLSLSAFSFAKVSFNFDAQMNGDLSVKEGDIVMIMKIVDDDWCEVRSQSGSAGLCPSNHLSPHNKTSGETLLRSVSFSNHLPNSLDMSATNRRKFEAHDFSVNKPKENKVEDLISRNLSVLGVPTQSRKSPVDKSFINYKEELQTKEETAHMLKEEVSTGPPSYPPPPPPTEPPNYSPPASPQISEPPDSFHSVSSVSSTEKNADHNVLESPPSLDVTLRHPGSQQSSSGYETQVRRSAPPIPSQPSLPPVRPPPPARQNSIDRAPHRPAPPVPIAGQTPVRRSLRRLPRQTSAPCVMAEEIKDVDSIKDLLHSKERQLQELQMVQENIESELGQTSESDVGYQDLKQRGARNENRMRRLKLDIVNYKQKLEHLYGRSNGKKVELSEERKSKMSDQRQNVISELVMTEKEFVRDLKMTYEVFNLHNPSMLEERGIDVKALFGNILEVLHVAENFLDSLQLAMKGRSDDEQYIGPVFLKHADSMKKAYSEYCTNHEQAQALLDKYKAMPAAQALFDKAMETLRYQVACFNVGSVLIKPVQRLLKYPLILNELIKCTSDDHQDKADLLRAVKVFTDMASDINEYKRRQDIVSKYLGDGTSTLAKRMAKLNLHSVAKKSSRLGAKLSTSLGLSMGPKDERFISLERLFHSLERTLRTFLTNLDALMNHLNAEVTVLFHLGEVLAMYYQERNNDQDVDKFRTTQRLIVSQYWTEFKSAVERRVSAPLMSLLKLFEGPSILIDKRNDKLLDYDNCLAKADKNKEHRQFQDELLTSKNNYEALNEQLIEDLPKLVNISTDLFVECLSAFVTARKLLSGKITKQYLNLLEVPSLSTSAGDAIEAFAVKHSLVCNQLGRFSFSSKSFRESLCQRKSLKTSPTPARQLGTDGQKLVQSTSQSAYLQNRYPADKLFRTIEEHTSADPLDLALSKGHLVGVIKKQDPMGNTSRWFVDNGVAQGFVRSSALELAQCSAPASPRNLDSSTSTCATPSPNKLRPDSAASYSSVRSSESGRSPRQSLSPAVTPRATPKVSPVKSDALPPTYEEVTGVSPTQHRYDIVPDDTNTSSESNIYEEINVDIPIYDEIPADNACTDLSPDPEFYYSLYDFQGPGEQTLPVKNGQVVCVLQRRDLQGNCEWWFVEDRFGKKGYVPANYLHPYTSE